MTRYSHSGGAVPTTLVAGVSDVSVDDMILDSAQGWPDGSEGPFFAVIDRGLATEEKVLFGTRTGTQVAVLQRGADGTPSNSHGSGAPVEHVFSALEADQANEHVNSIDGVHGVPAGQVIATEDFVLTQIEEAAPQDYASAEALQVGTDDPSLTTDIHSLPYPDGTDPVLVRRALEMLAEALDVAVPVIESGTTPPPDPTGMPDGTIYLRYEA
jgi:hypothetical protein